MFNGYLGPLCFGSFGILKCRCEELSWSTPEREWDCVTVVEMMGMGMGVKSVLYRRWSENYQEFQNLFNKISFTDFLCGFNSFECLFKNSRFWVNSAQERL